MTGMVAAFVYDGPINAEAFQAYVEHVLAPSLTPGDIVVMDNLSSLKSPNLRELIEAAGAKLIYLLPKLKVLLRKAPNEPSTAFGRRWDNPSTSSPPKECRNYFANPGYAAI